MDKYEYKLKLEQLKNLVEKKDYITAADIADSINWRKVKSAATLCMVGEIYDRNKRYDDSYDILQMAYDRASVGRNILYRLTLVCLKMGNLDEAREYYEEFLEVAPYDNQKYILRYQIAKLSGAGLQEQIDILEEFKEREYTEEWAFELAYLYHRIRNSVRCVEVCDELVLYFGDGKYVEKALELKMLYQPLNEVQEEKYRQFKQEGPEVSSTEVSESDQVLQEVMQIPDITANTSRFNTSNLQAEIAKSMQQILEADNKEMVEDTMHNIKKIVEEIPYLQVPQEELTLEEEPYSYIETDEEIDSSLRDDFREMLAEDWDGQYRMSIQGGDLREPQVNGQMRIEDVLAEWERTKQVAETIMATAQQRRLESVKARALQETREFRERLNHIIPKLEAGISPQELLAERYLQNLPKQNPLEEEYGEYPSEEEAYVPQEGYENYPQEEAYAPQGGYENYPSEEEAYVPQEGYENYPQEEAYVPQEGYENYPQEEAYVPQEGYENYPSEEEAYVPQKGYENYPQEEAYVPQGGYENYPSEEETYVPQEGYENYPSEEEAYVPQEGYENYPSEEEAYVPQEGYENYPSEEEAYVPQEGYENYPSEKKAYTPQQEAAIYQPSQEVDLSQEEYGEYVSQEDSEEILSEEEMFVSSEEYENNLSEGLGEYQQSERIDISQGETAEYQQPEERYIQQEQVEEHSKSKQLYTSQEETDHYSKPQEEPVLEQITSWEEAAKILGEPMPEEYLKKIQRKKATEQKPSIEKSLPKPIDKTKQDPSMSLEKLIEQQTAEQTAEHEESDAEQYLESVFRAAKASREEKVSVPKIKIEVPEEHIRRLSEEQKEIFSYFVPVTGMEQQLCQVLEGALHRKGKDNSSSSGNILIMGGRGSGKTVLATDLIKVIKKSGRHPAGRVGKITGSSLNGKELNQLIKKIAGGYLIIEKAGDIAHETAIRLSLLMEQNTDGLLVIMEDTRAGIEKVLSQDVNFAKKFTERVKIPVFTSDELVEFAKAYAKEQECEIDDMGILALYNRISNIQKLDEATTLTEVKDIMDEAIRSADRGGLKKLFGRKKFSPEGYLYLREKDFED